MLAPIRLAMLISAVWQSTESIYIVNDTTKHNDYQLDGNYLVKDCCFASITYKSIGGAILILNKNSFLNISSSTFFKCSANSGGGIYFNGLQSKFSRIYGEFCFLLRNEGFGIFCGCYNNYSSMIEQSSVYQCSNFSSNRGLSTLNVISDSFSFSSLNMTYNKVSEQNGEVVQSYSSHSCSISMALFMFCNVFEGSLISIEPLSGASIESSSFVSNSFNNNFRVIELIGKVNIECHGCIFGSNSGGVIASFSSNGTVILRDCFINPNCILNSSMTIINCSLADVSAYSLQIEFVDRCPQSASPSNINQRSFALSNGAIAGIAAGVSIIIGCTIMFFLNHRLKSREDYGKARAFELSESLSREFG